jgi:hypothetical protein
MQDFKREQNSYVCVMTQENVKNASENTLQAAKG